MLTPTIITSIIAKKDAKDLMKELKALSKNRVLVGVPEEENDRGDGTGIGNAALAYIHDNGSPKQGIPARPFMQPGIARAQNRINNFMFIAAKKFMSNDKDGGMKALASAGLAAQNGIRGIIRDGVGFAPLKRGTLLGRIRKRKGLYNRFKKHPELSQDKEAMMASFKPLMDTNEMLKSITYVIEEG
jgi:hypothetical protein